MNIPTMQNTRPTPSSQHGLSLVELMIALTISLVLLAGITSLIVNQSSTRDELEKSSRQIENGRYATQLLHDDIQHAGFYGEYFQLFTPGAVPDPCSTDPAVLRSAGAMALPLQGYDRAPNSTNTVSPVACIADANYKKGTDILVVRRAGTALVTSATTNDILLQSTAAGFVLDKPDTSFTSLPPSAPFTLTANDGITPAKIHPYWVHIYFISPCSVPAGGGSTCTGTADDNGRPIPTLKMLDITGATPTKPVPLVEGIENMQLDYGLDVDTPPDGYPDSYTKDPNTTANWANVMAVRVNLLARNTECTTGYADSKTYNLGLAGTIAAAGATAVLAPDVACTNGDYKRHVFSELVRAVNPSGRRARE